MRYTVTAAGHMLNIGGKRRRDGETITLNEAEAEFELLRGTIVEFVDKPATKAKGK